MNRIQLIGCLGAPPQSFVSPQGERFVSFDIATNEPARQIEGKQIPERTTWHHVRVPSAMQNYVLTLTKGQRVFVEGKLHYRDVQDDDGRTTRYWNIDAYLIEDCKTKAATC